MWMEKVLKVQLNTVKCGGEFTSKWRRFGSMTSCLIADVKVNWYSV